MNFSITLLKSARMIEMVLARLKAFKLPEASSLPVLMWQRVIDKVKAFRDKLSFAQKLYLVAIMLLVTKQSLALVALISVIAILLEFWPVFEKVWNSLAGKAVLLLFYAIIANFALANASAVVNEVVGVSASHFNYTHNFAILLYIPAWCIIVSGIIMAMVQICAPFYFIFIQLLKPLGIKPKRIIEHPAYHRTTFIVRVILSLVVLYHVWMLLGLDVKVEDDAEIQQIAQQWVDKQVPGAEETSNELLAQIAAAQAKKQAQVKQTGLGALKENSSQTKSDTLKTEPSLNADASVDPTIEDDVTADDYQQLHDNYVNGVRKAVALFAFYFEADSRSRCEKHPDAHVVELNDYEILEVLPDANTTMGYRFTVRQCVSAAFPLDAKAARTTAASGM
ncbi:hypothetical protein [Shewanella aestuarii]|uniref:Uncharacterized protein n=1 Tax=Shewanella aestuarii TaxID=1028752 RepID=A0A6G9QNC2_9GAMM|nr:hypothetical protein [Shewanella aestuarii]QIR15982.1 hypothetical protein HBH39_17135 [Shewanella aestuarii]